MRSQRYRAGELSEKVVIETVTLTANGYGGFSESTAAEAVFGHVRPQSGREDVDGGRLAATAGYILVIRARDDIDETAKIVWRGRRHNVRQVKRRGPRALYLEIEMDAGVAT